MLSYNHVLEELQNYILDDQNIQKSLTKKISFAKTETQCFKKPIVNVKSSYELFVPNDKDTLFWCFYIMKNGDTSYETLHHRTNLLAKQYKIDMVTKIRTQKSLIKLYKFDTIVNIESNLANDDTINPKTFLTLCAIEKINVIFIRKKTYFELLMNDTNIIYIVYELQGKNKYEIQYGFEITNETTLSNVKSSHYQVLNIDKPIKSLSAYKVNDLMDICNKLSIETINKGTGKNKTKNELYEGIIQYF